MRHCRHPQEHQVELTFDPLISSHTSGIFCFVCGLRTGGAVIRPAALGPDRLTPNQLIDFRELLAVRPGGWQDPSR